jgi:hypothetical protein
MWFIAAVYKYSFLVQELCFVLRTLIVTNAGSHLQQVYGRGRIEIS